jgi:PIN domain nuclease of toxin-antitoxin system
LIVYDSSAILAVLREETGSTFVIEQTDVGLISAINLGEIAHVQMRFGKTREEAEHVIRELGIPVIDVDAQLALEAAAIKIVGKDAGLSQADCICLALAKREGAAALTADRDWLKIADTIGVDVKVIR